MVDGTLCSESCRNWLESLDAIGDVQTVRSFKLSEVTREDISTFDPSTKNAQNNVAELKVEAAWAAGLTGVGITVGTIDSGVRFSHNALKNSYRGFNGTTYNHDYAFFSPTGVPVLESDNADIHGHGITRTLTLTLTLTPTLTLTLTLTLRYSHNGHFCRTRRHGCCIWS